jgi:hypothetical protein
MEDTDSKIPEQMAIDDLQNPKQITIEEILADN